MRRASSLGWAEHTVVVGAGPSGLTAAYALSRQGLPVTVVEKAEAVGGSGRTLEFMGCRFDLGPQPMVFQDERVEALLRSVMGRELRPLARVARAMYRGQFLHRPIRLSEVLVKVGPVEAARCLTSYARDQLRPVERPVLFGERVSNRLGARGYDVFVRSHLHKLWGVHDGEVAGAVDREEFSRAGDRFCYPRRGAGQIWETLAGRIQAAGSAIRLGEEVIAVRHGSGRVISVVVRDQRGAMMDVLAAQFVSAMPLDELIDRLTPTAPTLVGAAAQALKYRHVVSVNLVVEGSSLFADQWIDILDPDVRVARVSNFRNFSRAMVPDSGLSGLGMEYFCDAEDALWQMTDRELLELARHELVAIGLCRAHEVKAGTVYRRPKAYRVPGARYEQAAGVVREWVQRALPNLWLVEGPGFDDVIDQGDGVRSGLAVAESIESQRESVDILNRPFRSSSTVEQRAVNATVPGSNPGSGATPLS